MSMKASRSSGLTIIAAGRPFFVITISSSVEFTMSTMELNFIFASDMEGVLAALPAQDSGYSKREC